MPYNDEGAGYQYTDTSLDAIPDPDKLRKLRKATFDAVKTFGPMASWEIARALHRPHYSVQPRTTELKLRGLLRDSGMRRKNPETKRNTIVWEVVPPEERQMERNRYAF